MQKIPISSSLLLFLVTNLHSEDYGLIMQNR